MHQDHTSPPPATALTLVHQRPHIPHSSHLPLSLAFFSLHPRLPLSHLHLPPCAFLLPLPPSAPVSATVCTLSSVPCPLALRVVPFTSLTFHRPFLLSAALPSLGCCPCSLSRHPAFPLSSVPLTSEVRLTLLVSSPALSAGPRLALSCP